MAQLPEERGSDPPATTEGGRQIMANQEDRTIGHVVYVLYAIGVIFGLFSVAGVIVAYIKRGDVAGTLLESHFTWLIRTFWITLIAGIVGVILLFVFIGWIILIAVGIWYIWRVAKGWLKLNDGEALPDPQAWY